MPALVVGCALTASVACGGSQNAAWSLPENRNLTVFPQASTSGGIGVDVFKYGTAIPQASTWDGISVDAFKYGTAIPQASTWDGIGVDAFRYSTPQDQMDTSRYGTAMAR